jgi:hypothetical protein
MPLDAKKNLYALSASLSVLSRVTDYFFFEAHEGADESVRQLMTVELTLRTEEQFRGFHGAPMGGQTSPAFTKWLEHNHEQKNPFTEVDEAILETYCSLIDKATWKEMGGGNMKKVFRTACKISYASNGRFGLHCVGNACDIGAYPDLGRDNGCGYPFSCHNLDTPRQQLALLAGLAKLYDLASRDLDHKAV